MLSNVILLCAVHYNCNPLYTQCITISYNCVEWYIRFLALHIPLILGVKVLHNKMIFSNNYLKATGNVILSAIIIFSAIMK